MYYSCVALHTRRSKDLIVGVVIHKLGFYFLLFFFFFFFIKSVQCGLNVTHTVLEKLSDYHIFLFFFWAKVPSELDSSSIWEFAGVIDSSERNGTEEHLWCFVRNIWIIGNMIISCFMCRLKTKFTHQIWIKVDLVSSFRLLFYCFYVMESGWDMGDSCCDDSNLSCSD